MATTYLSWHNCYSEGWQNEIVPEAFSHPAKFSRALIRRIYAHALEQGYLKPGDWVADCFAGVGLGAADALALGLNWFGNELEQNFVDLGGGCDCTGISKADWVACFGRWKRFAHKDGRHWCPRCLAEAGLVLEDWEPALPGMEAPTVSYKRNSGKIPHTEPHRYPGNLDLFRRHARGGATAVLVQGDSRNLIEVLEGARAEGIIASPPFQQQVSIQDTKFYRKKCIQTGRDPDSAHAQGISSYGTDPAQLGNMPTGEPPQAIIASPPYIDSADCGGQQRGGAKDLYAESGDRYGKSDGQLGAMREGDAPTDYTYTPGSLTPTQFDAKAVVESITFTHADKSETIEMKQPPGAIISSPPWTSTSACEDPNYRTDRQASGGPLYNDYGNSDGQLAALPEGEPPQVGGLVSSPPYEGSMSHEDHGIDWSKAKKDYPGRLMHPQRTAMLKRHHDERRYGSGTDNLGNQQGNTFWSAARAILLQCHAVLAPGGVAIWVLKAFVRNKAIVDFPGQWEALCNSCGFETVEVIRAWLVEDRGAQFAFNGDLVKRKVARKSFFRRLYEAKARAAEFWKSVGRDDKARHLWQAHHDLWENRRSGLPDKKPPYPTRSRILGEAQMMAYAEAGKPAVEIDTQIDWEVVLITRKAA